MAARNSSLTTVVHAPEKIVSEIKDNRVLLFKAAVIVTSVTALYYSDLGLIFGNALEFTTGNITNYVLTIPAMSAFIIYRKRNILKAVALHNHGISSGKVRFDDILGIMLCVIAIMIYLASSPTLYALEFHILSLPIFLAGATILLFNIQTLRHAIIAILLTLYLQPPPGQLVSELAADLSWTSAILVEGLLSSVGVPISLDSSMGAPALLIEKGGGERIPFFVGEPSSGVFSTIGLSLFAFFVAYIIRGPTWKRILQFLSGFPLFFLLNTLRIAIVISLWYLWGEEVSEAYHIVSGSLMMVAGTLAVLFAGEWLLKLKIRSQDKKAEKCKFCDRCAAMGEPLCLVCGNPLLRMKQKFVRDGNFERIALLSFITFVAVTITTSGAASDDTSSTKKLSNLDILALKGPETTEFFFPKVEGWDQTFAYRDQRIESVLNQDAALAYRYVPADLGTQTVANPSLYASVQISTGHHVWEDSLVTFPSRVGRPGATIIESDDIAISDDKQARFLIFKRLGSESTEAVLYWFERLPLKFGSDFENRNVLISLWANTDSLAANGMIDGPRDSTRIRELYLSLAVPTENYWEEHSMGFYSSEILFAFLNQNLMAVVIAIIIPFAIFWAHHEFKRSKTYAVRSKLYQELLSKERSFIDALSPIGVSKNRIGASVCADYLIKSEMKLLESDEITETLRVARQSGLIKNVVSSVNDEPLLTWKINFKMDKNESKRELARKYIRSPVFAWRIVLASFKIKSTRKPQSEI